MKQIVKSALRAVGHDLTLLKDADRQTIGFQIKNVRRKDNRRLSGYVVEASHEGRPVRFFIANENDTIQGVQAKGAFYEPEELALIRRHYSDGTFVDIGANVGNHAIYVALLLNAPRIIAYEPNPEAYLVLRMNMALNDVMGRIEHRDAGLSSRNGHAAIAESPHNNLGATRLAEGEGGIRLVRGDDDLALENVVFIKIDTEGMELDVLEGLKATIKRCSPKIFVEVDNKNGETFQALVQQLNYRIVEKFQRYDWMVNYLIAPV